MSGQPVNVTAEDLLGEDLLFNSLPRLLKDHLSRPVPEQLWHYTSIAAMQSIIEDGLMYATDARFLNDREELIHAAKFSDRLIQEQSLPEQVVSFARLHVARTFEVFLSEKNPARRFVTCFTTKPDDLSQWRAYSGASIGASLGFDFRKALLPRELAPCIYEDDSKRRLLLEIFNPIFQTGVELFERDPAYLLGPDTPPAADVAASFPELDEAVKRASLTLLLPIMYILPLFKDKAFSVEDEWRIVKFGGVSGSDERNDLWPRFFRPRSDALVETMKVSVANRENQIPLTGLLIGPGCHPNAADSASRFLRMKGLGLSALASDVPYRTTR
jgi:hypothetical protein